MNIHAIIIIPAIVAQWPTPRPPRPTLWAVAIPGGITWAALNANEVMIRDAMNNGYGGDLPTSGTIMLPPGTYYVTAVGDLHQTATRIVTVL
jgi:hypothetical protein